MIKELNLSWKMRYLSFLLPLMFLAPTHLIAGVAEDQKQFYDILIITNPIQGSESRKELFTSNIDGELIINPNKISDNKISLRIQNCLLTDLQSNAGGANGALYRNIKEDMQHVLKVKKFYKDYAQIDRLYSSSFQILDDLLRKYYSNYEYQFECRRGLVDRNRTGAKLNTWTNDFSMIPRYMLDLVNLSKAYGRDINESDVFAVIKYDELLKTNISLAQKEKDKKNKYNQEVQNLKALSDKKSLDYTYELYFRASERKFCTTSRDNAESIMGHTMLLQKNNELEVTGKFFKVFKNIENAYQDIKGKNECSHFIDHPENIYKLHTALNRDKVFNRVGTKVESMQSKKIYVLQKGYKSVKEYDLVWALNLRKELIRDLDKFEIDSVDKFNEIQQKMLNSGYSDSKSARDVIAYLGDLQEARTKGIDILKQRDLRLDGIRKAREAQAAKREKQKIAYAKTYPYYAVLSCEANGTHANIVACFSGGKYGADTDLNLNGKIFKAYNINQAGDENSNGLAFDLKSDFSIVAQNTSDFLVLKLIITSRLTDKIVFQEEVGQYGVIRISD